MYLAENCPCCASTQGQRYPALVSPFVASYALGTKPEPTHLVACDVCGFRYFEHRLTDEEAGRLYADYRGERYFTERHRHEPWYTRKAHVAMGDDASVAARRQALVDAFLRRHVDVGRIRQILDYGGDRGQMIPQTFGADRAVYEISDLEPLARIERIPDATSLAGRHFDLVMLCHVLEHCSEPRKVLADIHPLVRTPSGVLYVEVPYERASLAWLGKNARYAAYLDTLRRHALPLTAVDLYSTLFRIRRNVVPPLGFVKMHEHINFFDERSLETLLRASGFEVVALEKMSVASASGISWVLGAAARLP